MAPSPAPTPRDYEELALDVELLLTCIAYKKITVAQAIEGALRRGYWRGTSEDAR